MASAKRGETTDPGRQEAEAHTMGMSMAHEGFPRSVPPAFTDFGADWLAGYDKVKADQEKDGLLTADDDEE